MSAPERMAPRAGPRTHFESGMLLASGKALDTFQLDNQHVFDEEIDEIFPDVMILVGSTTHGWIVLRRTSWPRGGTTILPLERL